MKTWQTLTVLDPFNGGLAATVAASTAAGAAVQFDGVAAGVDARARVFADNRCRFLGDAGANGTNKN